jgi:hypothetical protein
MPFCSGKRSAGMCVVLGSKNSSTYSNEYASGFFEPAASHLRASPFPRNEGLLGQIPSAQAFHSTSKHKGGRSWWVRPLISEESSLHQQLIDVTPAPVLAPFERLDNRVVSVMKVFRRVFVL